MLDEFLNTVSSLSLLKLSSQTSFLKSPFCFCTCLIVKIAEDVLIRKLLAEEKLGESVFIARKKAPNRTAEQKGVILLLVGYGLRACCFPFTSLVIDLYLQTNLLPTLFVRIKCYCSVFSTLLLCLFYALIDSFAELADLRASP